MKTFEFLASLSDSVENLIPDLYHYAALNLQSMSTSEFIEAVLYYDALIVFQQTETYLAFSENFLNRPVYTYYRDEFGDVHRADLYHPQD